MSGLVGVVPAAGGDPGLPYTSGVPKCTLELGGEPNLARVIAIMREQVHITDIVLVIGAYGQVIRAYFRDGRSFGVRIIYAENDPIEKGVSYSGGGNDPVSILRNEPRAQR